MIVSLRVLSPRETPLTSKFKGQCQNTGNAWHSQSPLNINCWCFIGSKTYLSLPHTNSLLLPQGWVTFTVRLFKMDQFNRNNESFWMWCVCVCLILIILQIQLICRLHPPRSSSYILQSILWKKIYCLYNYCLLWPAGVLELNICMHSYMIILCQIFTFMYPDVYLPSLYSLYYRVQQ